MIYVYECDKCDCTIEMDFPFGKAKEKVKCGCGRMAHRSFASAGNGFILKGSDWPGKYNGFGEKQKKKNERAGKNMRKTWGEPPKLVDQR